MNADTENMLVRAAIREQRERRIAETSSRLAQVESEGVLAARLSPFSDSQLSAELKRRRKQRFQG